MITLNLNKIINTHHFSFLCLGKEALMPTSASREEENIMQPVTNDEPDVELIIEQMEKNTR